MPRSRSRSPRRGYDRYSRDRRKRSRSPYQGGSNRRHRSRSPRRRQRSKSRTPPPRRPRSPFGRQYHGRKPEEEAHRVPANPANITLGGSLGVTGGKKKAKKKKLQNQQLLMANMSEDMTDEDKMMQQIMGFQGFDTTKNKKVEGNNVYAINKKVERKYRQYMNRKGGFNRPLEFMP
uniref:U4/U6.U5 small nuclear ribonucleoprotein 27 kDa protein-like n=1 Tax=Styela clava TaxID=7725 RepID=UPI001939BE1A|nr:U4/U6.U5 small nuclear ribonucleoprotein 27 kDa protein-like [Styela clava]